MKLYPKKLNSLEELKREKHLLLQTKKEIEQNSPLSLHFIKDSITDTIQGATNNEGIIGTLASVISSPSVADMLTSASKPVLEFATDKVGKGVLKSAAKEIIGGYLRWKAIELGYKGVKHLVKVRAEKRKEK
jgi:hypothetical protein